MEDTAVVSGKHRWAKLTLIFGVILPSISILVEATSHICAEVFFDPIPTLWHLLLVVFVPLSNLQLWFAIRRGSTERPFLLGLSNAFALGIAMLYTIVYASLLPMAVFALLFVGLGLLPMAPVFALISSIIMRRQLRPLAPPVFPVRAGGLVLGVVVAFAAVAVAELPSTLTRIGLQHAASGSSAERDNGLRILRKWGNKDALLRACYDRSGNATDLVGYLFSLKDTVGPQQAREVYYRLTGEAFNPDVPIERIGGHWRMPTLISFDPDLGRRNISGKIQGLTLSGSRMDASVDANGGLGYLEWTLRFKNDSPEQQEARAQVKLPKGAVVSRLTLWVNGEEREAVFAGRAKVEQAYQSVVHRRQDPALVTTAGRDRILVQCFPVPIGGEMQIRLGITVPLDMQNRAEGLFQLPQFIDQNFTISDAFRHAIRIESNSTVAPNGSSLTRFNDKVVEGTLIDSGLFGPEGTIITRAPESDSLSWSRDTRSNDKRVIQQKLVPLTRAKKETLVFVIDTSIGMRRFSKEIADSIRALPSELDLKLLFAGDNGVNESLSNVTAGTPAELAQAIEAASFDGGADSLPSLEKAWLVAAQKPNGAVVWIHGPQPIALSPIERLRQSCEHPGNGTLLYSVETEKGLNLIGERLDALHSFQPFHGTGQLSIDLKNLFAELSGQKESWKFVRSSVKSGGSNVQNDGAEASPQLATLWAFDEVNRLIASNAQNDAARLASEYRIVTAVSGAVVLETDEQYKQAGLEPPGSVPTIPEPEVVVLLAIAGTMLLFFVAYRRKTGRSVA